MQIHRGERNEDGVLMELERPVKMLNPDTLAQAFYNEEPRAEGAPDGWELEVSCGKTFDLMPGTYIPPEELVRFMKGSGRDIDLIISDEISKDFPLVMMEREGFRLNVFSGSNTDQAWILSDLGNKKEPLNDLLREEYQVNFYWAASGIWSRTEADTRMLLGIEGDDRPLLYDEDDCGATGVTQMASVKAVEELLRDEGGLNKFAGRSISLGVATPHMIVSAAIQAEKLGIKTELNVGYIAWGLTEGVGVQKEHANYIANVFDIDDKDGNVLAIGDVGDAARRVRDSRSKWEKFREDDYYDRETVSRYTWANIKGGNLRLAYAMGGLMVEGMRVVASANRRDSLIMAQGKRVTNKRGEFAARFGHLATGIEKWLEM